ncbi:hypothetical protein Tco_1215747 [Tanacetum coccineum]
MQPVTQPKALTDLRLNKKKILPFSKSKSSYKVRIILPKKQVAKTQHAKEPVATTDATKSLGAFESAKKQVNQPKTAEAEKVLDQNVHEELKESGLESIGDPRQLDDDAQIMFMGVEPSYFKYDQSKSTMHGASDSDSGLCLMPDDDLASLTGFETPNSANDDSKEGTAKTFYASANMPAQPDPLGPLHEELCILNTKIDKLKSSITKKVTDDVQSFGPLIVANSLRKNLPDLLLEALKNTLPQLIKDSIKQSVSKSIEEKLPVCAAHVQQSLQNQLLKILLNPMNKEFNALNTLESRRYRVISFSNDATMKITRGNDPLNVIVHDKFRLKTLGFIKKLGVSPPPKLSTFRILVEDRKRKRSSEILREVFVKENIVVDGMHRNLAPPPGIEGRREFYLATTVQLVRLQNDIVRSTLEALTELEIEFGNDVTKAREILKDNLDGIGQHM